MKIQEDEKICQPGYVVDLKKTDQLEKVVDREAEQFRQPRVPVEERQVRGGEHEVAVVLIRRVRIESCRNFLGEIFA